jgi:hypothetical protein
MTNLLVLYVVSLPALRYKEVPAQIENFFLWTFESINDTIYLVAQKVKKGKKFIFFCSKSDKRYKKLYLITLSGQVGL